MFKIIQLISEDIEKYKDITRESTITAEGIVRHRAEGMTNPNMKKRSPTLKRQATIRTVLPL